VPPHNQTPIKFISSHLLWKSLLIKHLCFKPFKTASEVSIHELWPLALLHVTPLACLLAATVSVSDLSSSSSYTTFQQHTSLMNTTFFFHCTSIFPLFLHITELQLILEPSTHQFVLLNYPVWLGTAVEFKILKSHACGAGKISTICKLRN